MDAIAAPAPRSVATPGDRRRHPRFPRPAVLLSIDGVAATVLDLSVGGLRAAMASLKTGQKVSVTLAVTLDGARRTITAPADVVAVDRRGASLAFSAPTYALMHFIVQFLARRHGVEPHTFR